MKFNPFSTRTSREKEEARRQVEKAREEARRMAEEHAYTVRQRMDAEKISHETKKDTNLLWDEFRRNGWTDMLLEGWGGTRR